MKILGLCLLLPCAAAASPEWDGVLVSAHGRRFALTDPDRHSSGWVGIGESWAGWTAIAYRPADETLVIQNRDRVLALRLRAAPVATELAANEIVALTQSQAAAREGWLGLIRCQAPALDQGDYWVYLDHVAAGTVHNRLVIVSPSGVIREYKVLPD